MEELYEILKPDPKTLIWAVASGVIVGILVYYFSRWCNESSFLKKQKKLYEDQIMSTIIELRSNQRGNRGDQKHPFELQQISQLLSNNIMKEYSEEFKILTNLKVDMNTLNSGGRVQNCVPGDIRWDRINKAITLLEELQEKVTD